MGYIDNKRVFVIFTLNIITVFFVGIMFNPDGFIYLILKETWFIWYTYYLCKKYKCEFNSRLSPMFSKKIVANFLLIISAVGIIMLENHSICYSIIISSLLFGGLHLVNWNIIHAVFISFAAYSMEMYM